MKNFMFLIKQLENVLILIVLLINCGKEKSDTPCLNSTVTIDVSSLESILLKADKILDNPDLFWENDRAYNLAKKWHEINKISMNTNNYYQTWKNKLKEINKLTEEQKLNHPSFKLMEDIIRKKEVFDRQAIKHICSFLPKNNVNLNTTVYITGHTLAWALMTHGDILINVLHSHYSGKVADDFMNTIVHEVFHIGYGKNRTFRTELELDDLKIYDVLDSFHNEGLAVYTGYKAQDFFPAPEETDYIMLKDLKEVKRLLKTLNDFLSTAKSLSEDELRVKAWDIGVTKRAYYVVGAFMAKTIDEKAGRESLVNTVKVGPMSFVSTYNKLVKPELQVYEFKLPDKLSVYQLLKLAVLNKNLREFNDLKTKIKSPDAEKNLEERLNSLGYNMLHRGDGEWAVRVFRLNTELYPESANAYDSLGEAYMKTGDKDKAVKNYKKSLELDPENDNARQMLKNLES